MTGYYRTTLEVVGLLKKRIVMFGSYGAARTQVTQDLLTNRVPTVKDFVERMPEITDMISGSMRDNEQFGRTVYVLSQLIPAK